MNNMISFIVVSIVLNSVVADHKCKCDLEQMRSKVMARLLPDVKAQMKTRKTYLSSMERRLDDTITAVLQQVHPTTTYLTTTTSTTNACSSTELSYNSTCIYLPPSAARVRFSVAETVCTGLGMQLLKITSNEMFDAVATYLADNWGARTQYTAWFWLGMTFEPINNPGNLITITPEQRIILDKWENGFPVKGAAKSSYTNMLMRVAVKRFGWENNGLSNDVSISNYFPLCQH